MPRKESPPFINVSAAQMESQFYEVLKRHGFTSAKANLCATVFTENSLDGVYTHGVNRFPRFIKYLHEGHINPSTVATCTSKIGCIEQWDGQKGPGPINALMCTDRVMEIASIQGMGCIALANTNHWMRGGTYGWRAAKKGFVFIGWTNTIANMPTWGAVNGKLGNNPLVIAVPFQQEAIVLDMAMSQYSYGALEFYHMKEQQLPVPGGFDRDGQLTTDPGAISQSQRILPIGYWKGAGLSLLLDILAAILSGGLSVASISKQKVEASVSQVFMAIALDKLANYQGISTAIQAIIDDYHTSMPDKGARILYPGERVLAVRAENKLRGIPVMQEVWDEIRGL